MQKINYIIIFFLILGLVYRLIITSDGNFLFNMDNARDMVDVREMVVLLKPRLIGHTAAIEGVFYGPFWYYLSAVPFLITQGDPYGSILLLFFFWTVGGYFALRLISRYGMMAMVLVGSLWVISNVVVLATVYGFNPNPAMLLTPMFVFLLDKYLTTKKTLFAVLTFSFAGMFFSFEIMLAVLVPFIVIFSIILTKNYHLFQTRSFLFGIIAFSAIVSPHILFELKHNFFMTHSLLNYASSVKLGGEHVILNPLQRFEYVSNLFYEILLPTFMNFKFFTVGILLLSFPVIISSIKKRQLFQDNIFTILLMYIVVTIIGYSLIPTTINSWHWVGVVSASILLSGIIIAKAMQFNIFSKTVAIILFVAGVGFSIMSFSDYFINPRHESMDPSSYKNELKAVDYVYQKSEGKNFKVYTYMPSVIDYPYQYLFWWRGLKRYGYVPEDYAYEPNKPPYISQKQLLPTGAKPESSGLIFLIKEPDRIGYRGDWEDHFKQHTLISSEQIGPLVVEIRKEAIQR